MCGFPSKLYDVNNPDWTPSIKLGYESNSVGRAMVQLSRAERYERPLKRQRISVEDDDEVVTLSLEEESTCTTSSVDNLLAMDTCSFTAVQTDLSFDTALDLATPQDVKELQSQLDQTKKENNALKEVIEKLVQKVKESLFDEAYFENDNKKVLYYTGLSTWKLFQKLFLYVKPHLKLHSSLTPFQQLLVTLMRLRLNLSGQDLGYRFQVHSSTISQIFTYIIEVLYVRLKPLII